MLLDYLLRSLVVYDGPEAKDLENVNVNPRLAERKRNDIVCGL